jgi:hypothetical protein
VGGGRFMQGASGILPSAGVVPADMATC